MEGAGKRHVGFLEYEKSPTPGAKLTVEATTASMAAAKTVFFSSPALLHQSNSFETRPLPSINSFKPIVFFSKANPSNGVFIRWIINYSFRYLQFETSLLFLSSFYTRKLSVSFPEVETSIQHQFFENADIRCLRFLDWWMVILETTMNLHREIQIWYEFGNESWTELEILELMACVYLSSICRGQPLT